MSTLPVCSFVALVDGFCISTQFMFNCTVYFCMYISFTSIPPLYIFPYNVNLIVLLLIFHLYQLQLRLNNNSNLQKCPRIFYTPPKLRRSPSTSLRGWSKAPTASLWMFVARVASKSPLSSHMLKLSLFARTAHKFLVSLPVVSAVYLKAACSRGSKSATVAAKIA